MEKQNKTNRGVLGVCVVVLFVVVALTFPYAFNLTWALPGISSDRTLTYTTGQLTWDSATDVDDSGTIHLDLFENSYDSSGVTSPDGENIVAPNTSNSKTVRLTNDSSDEIQYTAVLYRLDDTVSNIQGELTGGSTVTEYTLPQSVDADKVVSAIGGTIRGNNTTTMSLDWSWQYYTSDENDLADSNVGNHSGNTNVSYGLYVTVTEPDSGTDSGNSNTNGNANNNNNNNNNTNGNGNWNWNANNWNINNHNWNTDNLNINTNNSDGGLIDDIVNKAENVKNNSTNVLSGLLNRNTNANNRNTKTINTTSGLTNRTSSTNANTNGSTSTRIVTPTTGDNSQSALMFALALACMCAILAVIIQNPVRRRSKKFARANAGQMSNAQAGRASAQARRTSSVQADCVSVSAQTEQTSAQLGRVANARANQTSSVLAGEMSNVQSSMSTSDTTNEEQNMHEG